MSDPYIEQQKAEALTAIAVALNQIAKTYTKVALGTAEWGSIDDLQAHTGFSSVSVRRLIATGERSGGKNGWVENIHYTKRDQKSYTNFCYNIKKILEDLSNVAHEQ
jgi:hypothetical protein